MTNEEMDLSYPYSLQSDGFALSIVGGDNITKPVYCINCPLPHRAKEEPFAMNIAQAMEHVEECHHPLGQGMNSRGYEILRRNAKRYNDWRVAKYQEIKEATQAARLKKVLANG